ncbi:protein kinase domain-containing protein, partial [Nostoc edaphicum]|uniref:protein kinase domain-containing protein n=1 Tax=Nostoc edaphicum TaxID=264686 RepID=UPI001D152432
CNILDILYRHRIIHKDIKPANILINPETKQVKLIDFSIASLLPQETQTLISPNVLEGTLAYISPEQTGRMNRGIDYRTDFYSLGVTFYELLTGKLPFQSDDPMELVHSHIAKQPPSVISYQLSVSSTEIPQVLSDIVMKLMAKNADDRYQSALGLKFDLETCLTQLQETGKINSFPIAQRDVCDRFLIPEKLYGRETEVATLVQAFERVSETIAFRGTSSSTRTSTTGNASISDTLDFTSVLKAALAISSSLELDTLIASLNHILLENSGAKKCVLLLPEDDIWQVRAITFIHDDEIETILSRQSLANCPDIPVRIINYVKNTQQTVVIDNCKTDIPGVVEEYMLQHQPQSVFCTPLINQGHLVGIIYLENKLTQGIFNSDRLSLINLLSSQAAISLENAQLYTNLQDTEARFQRLAENVPGMIYQFQLLPDGIARFNYVSTGCYEIYGVSSEQAVADASSLISRTHPEDMARFQECITISAQTLEPWQYEGRIITLSGQLKWIQAASRPIKQADGSIIWDGLLLDVTDRKQAETAVIQKSQELKKTLEELQQAQLQVVQSEKMSALGNLVAGVAHEMNNPLGFIAASLKQTKPTIADIVEHLKLYQASFPNPDEQIKEHAEEIDLDYSLEDLPKIIDSMLIACDRLHNISTSLRTFSRADKDYKVLFNIHEGINSTILILKHRLKANEQRPAIEVITKYGNLPQVECFPGQLNQVFMNILANAIDALEESNTGRSFEEVKANPNRITITTSAENKGIKIAIADNAKGMTEEVKHKIFDHLFTTKSVGKGTGLGLAIARQIVEETHNGKLGFNSILGEGTEFFIEIKF